MGKKTLDREACRNVLVVAITPRRTDRQVDLAGVRENVRCLIKHGIDFIMPECGTGMVYDASLAEYETGKILGVHLVGRMRVKSYTSLSWQ